MVQEKPSLILTLWISQDIRTNSHLSTFLEITCVILLHRVSQDPLTRILILATPLLTAPIRPLTLTHPSPTLTTTTEVATEPTAAPHLRPSLTHLRETVWSE